jgi:hypothetical protein
MGTRHIISLLWVWVCRLGHLTVSTTLGWEEEEEEEGWGSAVTREYTLLLLRSLFRPVLRNSTRITFRLKD